ncbi:MAG: response regulator [Elusimicrobia bacterium]|nr:response regulator [Elusimicrobiota bacterium]
MPRKILVVDDEEGVVKLVEEMLKRANMEVFTATQGKKALSILKSRLKEIDVLITDILMPDIDGIELAETAKKLKPSVKIIALTGSITFNNLNEKGKSLFDAFLCKPFTQEDIINAIEGPKSMDNLIQRGF